MSTLKNTSYDHIPGDVAEIQLVHHRLVGDTNSHNGISGKPIAKRVHFNPIQYCVCQEIYKTHSL